MTYLRKHITCWELRGDGVDVATGVGAGSSSVELWEDPKLAHRMRIGSYVEDE